MPLGLRDVTLDTWVTADQHWEHPRIRQYQSRPEGHFELMHRLWVERVGEGDLLLHLGDLVCFGSKDAHPAWLRGLTGEKLMLRGNHDDHTNEWYAAAGFRVLGRGNKPFLWHGLRRDLGLLVAFSHEPINRDRFVYGRDDGPGSWDVNVHGHTHGNDLWDPLPGKQYVNACVERTGYGPVRLGELLGL